MFAWHVPRLSRLPRSLWPTQDQMTDTPSTQNSPSPSPSFLLDQLSRLGKRLVILQGRQKAALRLAPDGSLEFLSLPFRWKTSLVYQVYATMVVVLAIKAARERSDPMYRAEFAYGDQKIFLRGLGQTLTVTIDGTWGEPDEEPDDGPEAA